MIPLKVCFVFWFEKGFRLYNYNCRFWPYSQNRSSFPRSLDQRNFIIHLFSTHLPSTLAFINPLNNWKKMLFWYSKGVVVKAIGEEKLTNSVLCAMWRRAGTRPKSTLWSSTSKPGFHMSGKSQTIGDFVTSRMGTMGDIYLVVFS